MESAYLPFIIVTIVAILIAAFIGGASIILGGTDNWAEIRCDPFVMPFASLYGHDTAENFNYCMNASFATQANARMGPVYGMMAGMVGTLGTLVESTQKLRFSTANLYGGVTNIMRDFTERLKMFFIQIKVASQRMKMLMGRLYATFFAAIYMSMSGLTAVNNFTGTALFGVLDTFCFDPDTLVDVVGRGHIPIRHVRLGDTFRETGGAVTAVFEFLADGQPMVCLPGSGDPIIVSTNHYLAHGGAWIMAADHPDAVRAGVWAGGAERPIVCLNTSDHQIPVGGHIFRDYDETEAGHYDAMKFAHESLNGIERPFTTLYQRAWDELHPSVAADVRVCMRDGSKKAAGTVQLGDVLSSGDVVHGVIRVLVREFVEMGGGAKRSGVKCSETKRVAAGTLMWNPGAGAWVRAGDVLQVTTVERPMIFYGFITLPGSRLEIDDGIFLRDYFEVASPAMEASYTAALATEPAPLAAKGPAPLAAKGPAPLAAKGPAPLAAKGPAPLAAAPALCV